MKRVLFLTSLSLMPLAFVASAQTLTVSTTTVALNALVGNTAPVSQAITVTPSSGTPNYLVYNSNTANAWLGLATTSNGTPQSSLNLTAPDSFYILANPTTMPTGTSTGQVVVVGPGSTTTINVTFVVSTVGLGAQLPLTMSYQQNSTSFPQATLPLTGAATTYTVAIPSSSNCTWLLVPSSGVVPSTLTVSLNTAVALTLPANTYNCSFTLTPANASNTSLTIPVVLTVTTTPTITVSPASISMNYQNGTTTYPSQAFTITSNGTAALSYSLQAALTGTSYTGSIWFGLSKTSGTLTPPGNTDTVTVSYLPSVPLAANTYTGQIILTAGGAQQTIPVTLLVSNVPLLNLSSTAVTFTSELYGSSPAPVTVEATTTSGSGTINIGSIGYTNGSNWLSALTGTPTSAGTPISLSVNPSGLPVGQYKATVGVYGSNTSNNPQNIAVTLNVANDPLISTNVSTSQPLIFAYQTGISAPAPAAQTIAVSSTSGATLSYSAVAANTTASGCANWLTLSGATTGSTTGSFLAGANPTGIAATTTPGTPACTGTITITATNMATGNAAPNSPYVIPVSLYVSANALLVVTPDSAPAFTAQVGLANSVVSQNCAVNGTASCNVTLTSTSTSDPVSITVNTSTTDGATWLYALPTSASIPVNGNTPLIIGLAFSAVPTTPGSYSGVVTIKATTQSSSAVLDSPLVIPVTLQVTAGTPTASPTSLTFSQTLGGSVAAQTINVGSSTGNPISFTAAATTTSGGNWLSVTPASGTTPGSLSVTVSDANLTGSATPYQGAITITAAGSATSITVPVSFTVSPGTIAATPASLTFSQVQGGSAPAAQTITVTGTPGALNFTASATTATGGNWLSVSPASGSTSGSGSSTSATVSVTVSAGSLTPSTYNGTVTIASAGATGSPVTIPVSLTVLAPQTLSVTPSTLSFTAVAGQTSPSAQTASVTSSGSGTSFTATATTASGGNWLTVSPTSGVTPAQLTISVATSSLAAANYTGTIAINSPNATAAVTLTVNLTVATIPTPVITQVQNAGSYGLGGVSPGENIYIAGAGIGPATLTVAAPNSSGVYPTTLANTQVLFDGTPAPILYVSATATSVMVPYGIAGRTTTNITVSYEGVGSAPLAYNVVSAAPGIYTLNQQGSGPGAILNQNYSVNGPNSPAAPGSVVAVYMTGEGVTSPSSATGVVAPSNGSGLNKPVLAVTATVGGLPATVDYAGSAPGIVYGVMQVNLTIPSGLTNGAQPIVISVGTANTQAAVTVTVQNPTGTAEPQ